MYRLFAMIKNAICAEPCPYWTEYLQDTSDKQG